MTFGIGTFLHIAFPVQTVLSNKQLKATLSHQMTVEITLEKNSSERDQRILLFLLDDELPKASFVDFWNWTEALNTGSLQKKYKIKSFAIFGQTMMMAQQLDRLYFRKQSFQSNTLLCKWEPELFVSFQTPDRACHGLAEGFPKSVSKLVLFNHSQISTLAQTYLT